MDKYFSPKSKIHLIARGVLISDGNIILCRVKGKDWYFLPGGHVENGESSKEALLRELREEIGEKDYKITSFIGVCENIFPLDEEMFQQEVNIIFKVEVSKKNLIFSMEKDLEFIAIKKEDFLKYKILPETIKTGIQEYLKTNTPFLKEI